MPAPSPVPPPRERPCAVEPVRTVDDLLALVASGAGAPEAAGGEAVDQLAHALQCGAELRRAVPDDPELAAAGLVHDIGHLLVPGDDEGHGRVAGEVVRDLLGDRVARLAALHVPAKRYLVASDATYQACLSPVSISSLAHQGGGMDAGDLAAFARLPEAGAALRLRRADDAAKVPGRDVPELAAWRPLLDDLARSAGGGRSGR